MKFTESKIIDNGQGKWTVTVDGDQWAEVLKKARTKAASNLEIPGFRKGKAPESEITKNLTSTKIYNEAFKLIVNEAFDFVKTQDTKIEPLTTCEPIPFKVSDKEMVIDFVFELRPEIKIGKYKGITAIEKPTFVVTQEEINESVENYQQRFAMEKNKEENAKVEKGDSVTFDFKGYIDNVAFKGGEAKDHTLIIGSNQFIPGFEDSMIGLGLGKSEINVQFPENYTPELSGKSAIFKLNIKEIKSRILPKKDDELAKDLNIPGVTTFKELEKSIKDDLAIHKEQNAKNQFVDEVIREIIKNSEIDIPKSAIDRQIQDLKKEFEQEVIKQGITLKEYKKATGLTDQMIENEIKGDAKFRLQTFLVSSEVKKQEKFEPNDQQIEEKYEQMAKRFGVEVSYIKEIIKKEQLTNEIVNEVLTNFLYENNGK